MPDSSPAAAACSTPFRGLLASLVAGLVCSFWLTFAFEPVRFGWSVYPALVVIAWAALRRLPQADSPTSTRGSRRHALVFAAGTLPFWLHQSWFVNSITAAGAFPISVYLSLYLALAVWLLRLVTTRFPRLALTQAFPAIWLLIEILRGEIVFHGYAWYLISFPLIDLPLLAAPARFIGAYGVCALVAASVGALLDLVGPRLGPTVSCSFATTRTRQIAASATLLLVMLLSAGAWLHQRDAESRAASDARPLHVGIVQTNLPQSNKLGWSLPDQLKALDRWLELSKQAAADADWRADVIVWPETMKPGLTLDDDSVHAERAAQLGFSIPDEHGTPRSYSSLVFTNDLLNFQSRLGVPMLIGEDAYVGLRFDSTPDGIDINYDQRFNSVFLLRAGKPDPQRYDKQRLTPFGEEMPYVDQWPWLKKTLLDVAARGMRLDLSRGTSASTFDIPTPSGPVRVGAPICYEITETTLVSRFIAAGAQALVHVTNDGWFGASVIGRREHLDICRWRALEFGVPVVRSANTGISASIDAFGRILARGPQGLPAEHSGMDVDGIIHATMSVSPSTRTPYATLGNLVGWIGFGAGLALMILAVWRGRRPHA